MPSDKKLLGDFGEDAACAYLKKRLYRMEARHYSCRMGEVDIIARREKYIVFAEVKLRRNADFGEAKEFVTPAKQRRVIIAAESWIMKHPTELQPRFDVIEVYAPDGIATMKPEIHHIEDAFQL